MESILTIFRTGLGPSSSHTMGPRRAAEIFLARYPHAVSIRATLFGSLAATGKGHFTDKALGDAFLGKNFELLWKPGAFLPLHPNGMLIESPGESGQPAVSWEVYSTGGGELAEKNPDTGTLRRIPYDFEHSASLNEVYPDSQMSKILDTVTSCGNRYWDYITEHEGDGISESLGEIWRTMRTTIARGIETEGTLPGGLMLSRKAHLYFVKSKLASGDRRLMSRLFAYALAMAEENASGGIVVTAPTCGSCGVVPAVLLALSESLELGEKQIVSALGTAGLFGVVAKKNGSISGAEVGCQGEVGVACAMAAAAAAKLMGGSPRQVEYAAEIGLEHHLGLTCDPMLGLVQIPCIERNALAATTAVVAAHYATLSDGYHLVSYDEIVDTMLRTGRDMRQDYRETSTGGMAVIRKNK